jgi:hypothetical protein
MTPEDRAQHIEAMTGELNKILDAGHARWESLPPGEIAIPSVGVFRIKSHDLHTDGGYHLKARFCANGQWAESPSGGWEATANVASISQILALLAIATELNFFLAQMDVRSAFTQVKLGIDQKIWVRPLPGLGDPERKGRVLRLVHHLYGHPLANAAWAKFWLEIMTDFGFQVVDRLGTVFAYKKADGLMLCATVVDDSAVAYNNEPLYERFKVYVSSKVPITSQPLEHICGLRVVRDMVAGTTKIDQTEYIAMKAAAFGVDGAGRDYKTPMEADFKLGPRPEEPDSNMVSEARSILGSIIYGTITRPECKFPCSKLSTIATNPVKSDISAMKRVLRYMYQTKDTTLTFRRGWWTGPDGKLYPPNTLIVFVDAGFGQEKGRRSQTGFLIMLNGAVIFAKSGRQTQLADSTGYAETIALHEASHYVVAYRRFMEKMFLPQVNPTPIFEDNSAAVVFAHQGMGSRSMHYEIKYLYIHDLQLRRIIDVLKIGTLDQLADVLTKPLPWHLFQRIVEFMIGGPLIFSQTPAGALRKGGKLTDCAPRWVKWSDNYVQISGYDVSDGSKSTVSFTTMHIAETPSTLRALMADRLKLKRSLQKRAGFVSNMPRDRLKLID